MKIIRKLSSFYSSYIEVQKFSKLLDANITHGSNLIFIFSFDDSRYDEYDTKMFDFGVIDDNDIDNFKIPDNLKYFKSIKSYEYYFDSNSNSLTLENNEVIRYVFIDENLQLDEKKRNEIK